MIHSRKTTALPLPKSNKAWLKEIAEAYLDAAEVNAYQKITGTVVGSNDLFHLAPAVCLKFRGLALSGPKLKVATDAALTSYVATTDMEPDLLSKPHVGFAFCFLSAHFGLDIVEGSKVEKIMDFVLEQEAELEKMIVGGL